MIFESLDYDTDGVEERHFGIWQINLPYQRHQPLQSSRGIR